MRQPLNLEMRLRSLENLSSLQSINFQWHKLPAAMVGSELRFATDEGAVLVHQPHRQEGTRDAEE